jgi:nucleobase transporter 1/2
MLGWHVGGNKYRSINPVVVAPTVAAVGLAFFAYGFPVVGTCVEIGIPQVLIIVFFALVSDLSGQV